MNKYLENYCNEVLNTEKLDEKYEYFSGSTIGVGDFSTTPGTTYGFSPHRGTEHGISVTPGVNIPETDTETESQGILGIDTQIIPFEIPYNEDNIIINLDYIRDTYGQEWVDRFQEFPNIVSTILNRPLNTISSTTNTYYGVKDMIDIHINKLNNNPDLSWVGGQSFYTGNNFDIYDSMFYEIALPEVVGLVQLYKREDGIGDPQGVVTTTSIPTFTPGTSETSSYSVDTSYMYDVNKKLTEEQLKSYEKHFRNIFGSISPEDEEELKRRRKLLGIEEYKPKNSSKSKWIFYGFLANVVIFIVILTYLKRN